MQMKMTHQNIFCCQVNSFQEMLLTLLSPLMKLLSLLGIDVSEPLKLERKDPLDAAPQ